MPWTVQRDPEMCSLSEPWAVIRLSNGELEGCHASEAEANEQVAALYAAEEDPADDMEMDDDGMFAAIPTHPSMFAVQGGLPAADLHVTLRYFTGTREMDPLLQRELSEIAKDVAGRYDSFDVRICGAGYLGPNRSAVAFLEHETLEEMYAEINELVRESVSEPTYPHFIPHMTLGSSDVTFDREYVEQLMATPLTLGGIRLALGNRNSDFDLGRRIDESAVPVEVTVNRKEETTPDEEAQVVDDNQETETDIRSNPEEARARVSSVPPAGTTVSTRASRDLRGLPEAVLSRMKDQGEEVGVVDRVGRGLFEMRFRPEMRMNADGSVFLHGYGTVYDFPYEVMGGPPYGWVETITRGACLRSVQHGADVRLLINHDGIALARTRSGTLQLESDDIGLYCCAPSLDPRSPTVQSLISAMNRGDMDEMSFAFKVIEQDWNEEFTERQISEVRLYDVSVVTYPANPATVTSLRRAAMRINEIREVEGINAPAEDEGLDLSLAETMIAQLDVRRRSL